MPFDTTNRAAEWDRLATLRYRPMITPEALAVSPALVLRIAACAREIPLPSFGLSDERRAVLASATTLSREHWLSIRHAALREPGLVALWFVDMPDLYLHAHAHWPRPTGIGMWYPSLVLFHTDAAQVEDWLRAPWFTSFPGVWAEISGGAHIHFVPQRSADAT